MKIRSLEPPERRENSTLLFVDNNSSATLSSLELPQEVHLLQSISELNGNASYRADARLIAATDNPALTLQLCQEWLTNEDRELQITFRKSLPEIFSTLLDLPDSFSITGVRVDEDQTNISVRKSIDSDRSSTDIQLAFHLAGAGLEQYKTSGTDSSHLRRYVQRYYELLNILNLDCGERRPATKATSTASSLATEQQISNQNEILHRKYLALSRKYKSLAESHLGSLTLKYWNWRRK